MSGKQMLVNILRHTWLFNDGDQFQIGKLVKFLQTGKEEKEIWGGADKDHCMTGILGARTFQLCPPQPNVK